MDADQHVLAVADLPFHQRDVRFLVEAALERDDPELAVVGRQRRGGDPPDERLGPHPVLIRSAIVIIGSLCRCANFASSGTRAIVPSSFMISQMTPAG